MPYDAGGLVCADEQQRRADLLAHPDLNGLDYVEVDAADQRLLRVHFVKPVAPANPANPDDPADAHGISADVSRIAIAGGSRIVGIRALSATRRPAGHMDVEVDRPGDFSEYMLTIDAPRLDPLLRRVAFSFKADCPVDVDCRPPEAAAPLPPPPALDYLAKDYASFRRLLLERLAQLDPAFVERSPADLGIALVELLAYVGDHLSYFQDAVANEAYLDTARRRISVRRHTRLVDYRMHDGRNAWTYAHVAVAEACTLEQGTRLLTRVVAPLVGSATLPPVVLDPAAVTADALERDPALAAVAVFETAHPAALAPENNEILLHAWGNEDCWLRPGATEAFLYTVPPDSTTAVRPRLRQGDYLLLEEARGPRTGAAADADPAHRQVVRIDEEPVPSEDPLYGDALVDGALQRWQPGQPTLPLLRVRWRPEDGLRFPLCLATRLPDGELARDGSVARGNLVLADHGLTTDEPLPVGAPLHLPRGPLTQHCAPDALAYDPATGRPRTARYALAGAASAARPAVALRVSTPSGDELWTPVPDLLDSPPFGTHFVAEVDDDGRALLRFGDGEYGRALPAEAAVEAVYRVGNGRAGNVGAEALAHVALPADSQAVGRVIGVRNPLPAQDGEDPETIEAAREWAPQAFRAEQLRAVTEADYVAAAQRLPEVAGAAARFRWTGSWHSVCVAIDPRDPTDLIPDATGRLQLAARLEARVRAHLTRYRLAGYDLEIRAPTFVPLEIDLEVCVASGYFHAEVAHTVADALSNRVLPSGQRGFFHPDRFTFGQSVYLSQLYAAVERVEGVDSAVVRRLRRLGQPDNGELARGVLPIGPWEIALLANDPNFLEQGVLRIVALGGKG